MSCGSRGRCRRGEDSGSFWLPAVGFLDLGMGDVRPAHPHPTGDHKGPPPRSTPPSPLREGTSPELLESLGKMLLSKPRIITYSIVCPFTSGAHGQATGACQTRTMPSSSPEAIRVPSGDHATASTSLW